MKLGRNNNRNGSSALALTLITGLSTLTLSNVALAMGKAPPATPPPPVQSAANPVRQVYLTPVGTLPFQMPNGHSADLNADLNVMMSTSTTGSPSLQPTTGNSTDPCSTRVELRANISTLDLDVADFGLSFGYTSSGGAKTPGQLGVTGAVNVNIGNIAMDFGIWECTNGTCSEIAAVTENHLTAGVNLAMKIDFGQISAGPDLLFNTPLGDAIRKIMDKGIADLSASSRLSELPWKARVLELLAGSGSFWMDAGANARLAPNQMFAVFAVTPATGICSVYKPMAYVHTTQVEVQSSLAVVDSVLDPRGIQDGDVVMIRAVASMQ